MSDQLKCFEFTIKKKSLRISGQPRFGKIKGNNKSELNFILNNILNI